MQELNVARQAARTGADIVARYFRDGVTMRSKETYNLVSDADVIRSTFPDHAILGEETHRGDANSEHVWIVDPLDGTNNFAHGIPHFAVSIGYYQRGQPAVGVVLNPVTGDCFEATRGNGAIHNGRPIHVSRSTRLTEELIGVGFYYDRGAMMEATLAAIHDLFGQDIHGIRRFGTASLDLCMVAGGRFGAFFEYELSPWDFAAGRLIVEEAGGRLTTCRGAALLLERTSVLASNSTLHEVVLDIVRRHHYQRE